MTNDNITHSKKQEKILENLRKTKVNNHNAMEILWDLRERFQFVKSCIREFDPENPSDVLIDRVREASEQIQAILDGIGLPYEGSHNLPIDLDREYVKRLVDFKHDFYDFVDGD